MASKYADLKGRIPEEQTARDAALIAELEAIEKQTVAELTAGYNEAKVEADALASKVKAISVRLEARNILIRQYLSGVEADALKLNGYTWSEKPEPYPVTEDPAAVVKYFKENGMEDQLELSASELNSRLKNFIKDEALRNELQIDTKEEIDEQTGETKTITEVRSKIPGVKVFLKPGLSRVKSSNKITGVA